MRLPNEGLAGKTAMTNDCILPNQYQSWKQQPEIDKTRKRVFLIISVLLGLCCVNFIVNLIIYATQDSAEHESTKGISQLLSVLFSAVYYGLGFYATYRYSRKGLLIFAWFGLLSLLTFAIFIIVATIYAIKSLKADVASTMVAVIIFIIVCFIASILQIFAVRYAFALAKLLKNKKPTTTERV